MSAETSQVAFWMLVREFGQVMAEIYKDNFHGSFRKSCC